ncbi:MAG: metalloregulator ArsR/SmtB family transcription factor [Tissierellia bacterium]|nr:metalloregulator ArsR/SmtB family transcription factor [Tissierellia bacterium]
MPEEVNLINEDKVNLVLDKLTDDDTISNIAYFLKNFGDSTRIKILKSLSISELCVYDLSYILNISQSAVSHQLKTLKDQRIVKSRRDGKVVYYSLDDEHIQKIIEVGEEHILE